MEFRGMILFLVKDRFGCVHIHKKKSKDKALTEKYIEYIQKLKETLGSSLIRAYIINLEVNDKKFIWGTNVWRTELKETISPNHKKYINYLTESRKELKFIGPYKSMRTKGVHLCNRGHEWSIQPIQVKEGAKCPKCKVIVFNKESNGAKYITGILSSNNIEFIKEVPLKRFGYEENFPMDFLICNNNHPLFFIEFNGIQHYKPISPKYFGGVKGYRERKRRDKYKRDCCWKIGLPVIDIPYNESEKQIKESITYFLKLYELI